MADEPDWRERVGRCRVSGRLVLLRHGQSRANVERRLDTRPPGSELTELGYQQARRFASNLHRSPTLIAHSAALRAAQTAAEVANQLGMVPVELPDIHEVQAGDLENRNDDQAIEQFEGVYRRWHLGERHVILPGGESAEAVLRRYLPVLAELRLRHLEDGSGGDVVVVSHGAAIRLVASVLAGIDPGFVIENRLPNCQAVMLAPIADGRWSCVRWCELTPPFEASGPGGSIAARFMG